MLPSDPVDPHDRTVDGLAEEIVHSEDVVQAVPGLDDCLAVVAKSRDAALGVDDDLRSGCPAARVLAARERGFLDLLPADAVSEDGVECAANDLDVVHGQSLEMSSKLRRRYSSMKLRSAAIWPGSCARTRPSRATTREFASWAALSRLASLRRG